MFIASTTQVGLGCGLLFLLATSSLEAQSGGKSVAQLKREVEERKLQVIRAKRQLAEASANVALAEGKRDLAITELSSVVACYQSEAQWIRDHVNSFCDPRDLMTETLWETSKVAVRLAELKGDNVTLVAEWKKIVGFHEQELKRVELLAKRLAIKPEEKSVAEEALAKARMQLAAAEKKAEQEKKVEQPR